jgi:hypothetical protein
MKSYLEHIETGIAALSKFRMHPVLAAEQVERLDRKIAQYQAVADEARARGR